MSLIWDFLKESKSCLTKYFRYADLSFSYFLELTGPNLFLIWAGVFSGVIQMSGSWDESDVFSVSVRSPVFSLLWNREIDTKVLDAIVKSELGENIFGSLDMLSHALSFGHSSESSFYWAHLVRTFMRLKNWVSDRYTHQGLLFWVKWLGSRLPVKEVPLDRVPPVFI